MTPKSSQGWVKALLHSVYDQPDAEAVRAQFDRILDGLAEKLPTVAEHLEDAREDVLAFPPQAGGTPPTRRSCGSKSGQITRTSG